MHKECEHDARTDPVDPDTTAHTQRGETGMDPGTLPAPDMQTPGEQHCCQQTRFVVGHPTIDPGRRHGEEHKPAAEARRQAALQGHETQDPCADARAENREDPITALALAEQADGSMSHPAEQRRVIHIETAGQGNRRRGGNRLKIRAPTHLHHADIAIDALNGRRITHRIGAGDFHLPRVIDVRKVPPDGEQADQKWKPERAQPAMRVFHALSVSMASVTPQRVISPRSGGSCAVEVSESWSTALYRIQA